MKCIKEENYFREMQETVLPYLEAHKTTGTCHITSGPDPAARIYYEAYRRSNPRGTVVISHGFSESIQKYKEMIYYFLNAGYQVFLADHRGHGYSMRETDKTYLVHTSYFHDYVRDLHTFFTTVVRPDAGKAPCFLLGHSMGGAIAAAYLETYPDDFDKAVLTAPMLRIRTGRIPEPVAFLVACFMKWTGRGDRPVLGQPCTLDGENFSSSSSLSEARFQRYLRLRRSDSRLQTSAASYNWLYTAIPATHRITFPERCRRIRVPVLLFLAGQDKLVKPYGIRLFAHQVKDIRLCRVNAGKHELYSMRTEELEKYYGRILRFFRDN
ncbi:MAG: alpha/beta fold hydrolase [Lachnospiraceae bacterium]|nr:alpha/beta fold hydrolase [Lachnospiraceae bacterium]